MRGRSPVFAITLAFFFSGWSLPAHAQEKDRGMNVLVIISDDLNMDMGCYGHPTVKTPNLDRLAKRGMLFQRAYAQYPLCNPSRTSFMSGRRPETTKIFTNDKQPRATLGNILS